MLAPTGTIAFLMDCDTTGIEPDIAIVKYKRLVGGGLLKIVNQTVPEALTKLGYTDKEVEEIVAHIDAKDTIEGAPHLKDEHLPVFDCAFRSVERHALDPLHGPHPHDGGGPAVPLGRDLEDGQPADRLHGRGHRGRVHPGVEARPQGDRGLPRRLQAHAAAVDEPGAGHVATAREPEAAVAASIDRSSCSRPKSAGSSRRCARARRAPAGPPMANRYKLPDERASFTHKFSIGGHEGYITVGMYEDGSPGEIFVRMAKEGSVDRRPDGLVRDRRSRSRSSTACRCTVLIEKFKGTRFEPSGFTGNQEIPIATSIMDYLFRWLAIRFPSDGASLVERHPAARAAQLDLPKVPLLAKDFISVEVKAGVTPAIPVEVEGPRVGPGDRRAAVPRVRHADGAQRRLPQVPELRLDERLLLTLAA